MAINSKGKHWAWMHSGVPVFFLGRNPQGLHMHLLPGKKISLLTRQSELTSLSALKASCCSVAPAVHRHTVQHLGSSISRVCSLLPVFHLLSSVLLAQKKSHPRKCSQNLHKPADDEPNRQPHRASFILSAWQLAHQGKDFGSACFAQLP